ncbi:glycosyltransferase [Cyclobacterium salsum]|uniref:glycosyltransferase n=1 Tax=Cyclobacterium salsum TaxID=2666329 RepID=UPI001391B50E|nr:glycosyltransferase [Cyclobacterium salsum]
MKIIRLCTLLNFGGLEQRLVNISHINDGHEWIFCALGTGGEAAEEITKNGKRVVLLDVAYTIPSVKAIQKLVSFFLQEKPDVVHTSGAEANFHGIIAAKMTGVKRLIAEEIGIPNQKIHHKIMVKIIYKFPDYVLANSKPVTNYLEKENGVNPKILKIIPNPLNAIAKRAIQQSYSKDFQILTISRLKVVKNIEGILKVIALLVQENHPLKFTVIGDGDNFLALKERASDLGIAENVEFKGFIPSPLSGIKETNLFILNSFTEGFSNALVEAMSAGIPCLATDVGAAGDLIEENETGWLVKPGDEQDLYIKMKFILSLEKERLAEVGNNGRNAVIGKYHLNRHISQLMEAYQK